MKLAEGTQVRARACEFSKPIRGYIVKINEKTAVVRIENTSDCDKFKAKAKSGMAIVNLKDITVLRLGKWIKPGKVKGAKHANKARRKNPGAEIKFTDRDGKVTVYANARLCGEAIGRDSQTIYNTCRQGGAFSKRSELYGCKVERMKVVRTYDY